MKRPVLTCIKTRRRKYKHHYLRRALHHICGLLLLVVAAETLKVNVSDKQTAKLLLDSNISIL